MPRPGPSVTSGADLQPGSDSLFPSGFTGGGARPSAGSVGTSEIADGSVSGADLNLASVTAALNGTYAAKNSQEINLNLAPYNVAPGDDITTALQSAINTIAASGTGGRITFSRSGTYNINGAQQTGTALGYSYSGQILYPAIKAFSSPSVVIEINGGLIPSTGVPTTGQAHGGVVLQSNATSGYVFDMVPYESAYGQVWTGIMPIYRNLILRLPSNPQCGGINNLNAQRAKYERIQIDNLGGGWTDYASLTGTKEAIAGPQSKNNGDVTFRDISVRNHPVAVRVSEHFTFEGNTELIACKVAFIGSYGGHRNYLAYVDIEQCGTLFKVDAQGLDSLKFVGLVDIEPGLGSTPCVLVDDAFGSMVQGTLDLVVGDPGGYAWKGGYPYLDITNKSKAQSGGWSTKHPHDTFVRNPATLTGGATVGAPGTMWPSMHPWRTRVGGFNITGGVLKADGTSSFNHAMCPVRDAIRNGAPRAITTVFNLAASGYSVAQIIGRKYDAGTTMAVQLRNGNLYLSVGAFASGSGTAQASGVVSGGTTVTLRTEVYYRGGSPKVVKCYLNGALTLTYALTSTQQATVAASTTYPYMEDGINFGDSDFTSTCSLYSVTDVDAVLPDQGSGTVTLTAGAVTVSNPLITSSSIIRLSRQAAGGTLGQLSVSLSAGASFTINSSSNTDTSVVYYEVVSY